MAAFSAFSFLLSAFHLLLSASSSAKFDLVQPAQYWFIVVLIWIGFGTLAGLLAKALLPTRQPSSAVVVITLGIVGTVIGPLVLSVVGLHLQNPLGPVGLLASIGGALLLMILYYLRHRRED